MKKTRSSTVRHNRLSLTPLIPKVVRNTAKTGIYTSRMLPDLNSSLARIRFN